MGKGCRAVDFAPRKCECFYELIAKPSRTDGSTSDKCEEKILVPRLAFRSHAFAPVCVFRNFVTELFLAVFPVRSEGHDA